MSYAVFIAIAFGLAAGALVGYRACMTLSIRLSAASRMQRLVRSCSWLGALISLLPSLFMSFVIGGNLGGSWAEAATISVGFGSLGVPVGLAIGIATVLAAGISVGSIAGGLFGKTISRAFESRLTHRLLMKCKQ